MYTDKTELTNEWLAYLRGAISTANHWLAPAASGSEDEPAKAVLKAVDLHANFKSSVVAVHSKSPLMSRKMMETEPAIVSLTAEFNRRRNQHALRPMDALDQDKLAQRVYNLLYNNRYDLSIWEVGCTVMLDIFLFVLGKVKQQKYLSRVSWHGNQAMFVPFAALTKHCGVPTTVAVYAGVYWVGLCEVGADIIVTAFRNAVCEKTECANVIHLQEVGALVNVVQKGVRPAFSSSKDDQILACKNCETTLLAASRAARFK